MADPHENEIPENATWGAHMRAIRRELSAITQNQIRLMEHMGRLANGLNELRTTVTNQNIQIQSDLLQLEGHNMTRQGEVMNILERLDRADVPKVYPFAEGMGQVVSTEGGVFKGPPKVPK